MHLSQRQDRSAASAVDKALESGGLVRRLDLLDDGGGDEAFL